MKYSTSPYTKNSCLFLVFFLIVCTTYGQTIKTGYGPAYTATKQVIPIINGKKGDLSGSNTSYVFSIIYEHYLRKKPIALFASYSIFDGYTFVFFEKGGVIENGAEVYGAGYSGVRVCRYDLGAAYNLIDKKRKFYMAPFISSGIQASKPTGEDIYPFVIKGPNYVETEPTSAETLTTYQIVPSIGLSTGFVFWKRLDIGLSFQGVLGHKPYQKMYFKYEYKGVPQKTGKFEANGTGLFVTLGVGYRFTSLIK